MKDITLPFTPSGPDGSHIIIPVLRLDTMWPSEGHLKIQFNSSLRSQSISMATVATNQELPFQIKTQQKINKVEFEAL